MACERHGEEPVPKSTTCRNDPSGPKRSRRSPPTATPRPRWFTPTPAGITRAGHAREIPALRRLPENSRRRRTRPARLRLPAHHLRHPRRAARPRDRLAHPAPARQSRDHPPSRPAAWRPQDRHHRQIRPLPAAPPARDSGHRKFSAGGQAVPIDGQQDSRSAAIFSRTVTGGPGCRAASGARAVDGPARRVGLPSGISSSAGACGCVLQPRAALRSCHAVTAMVTVRDW